MSERDGLVQLSGASVFLTGHHHGERLQLTFSARTFVKEMFAITPTRHGGGRRCHARAALAKLIGTVAPIKVTSS